MKTKIIITILVIGLIFMGYYIGYNDFYKPKVEKDKENFYVSGYNYGIEQVILKINQERSIPVIIQNGNQSSIQWTTLAQICGQ